jgi:hypothetical protein
VPRQDAQRARRRLWSLAPDLSPLRGSRDLRPVVLGNFISGMGTQATLVALPYEIYVLSHSARLVGLLGALAAVSFAGTAGRRRGPGWERGVC